MSVEKKYKVINPYHFIPLRKKHRYEEKIEELITGKMTIEIKTETPLFIPNISSERKINCTKKGTVQKEKEHSQYEFFSYHQYDLQGEEDSTETKPYEPILPGSEIRGMLRSIYEAFTCSCMSAIDLDKPLYKRTSDYYQHGMLEYSDNVLKLYALNMVDDVIMVDKDYTKGLKDGQYVTYKYEMKKYAPKARKFVNQPLKIISEDDIESSGKNCGILLKGERGVKKKWAKIFNVSNLGAPVFEINLKDEKVRAFEHVLQAYQDERINKSINEKKGWYEEYVKCWEKLKKGERRYLPVYYSKLPLDDEEKAEKMIYLSPACITKESYYKTFESILTQEGVEPCKSSKDVCPTCQLFGMVGENSIASKLRFADARLDNSCNIDNCMYKDFVILEELAQPKISATEMYVQRPQNAKFWTYDYYVQGEDIKAYTETNPVKLMGRKFYWHHPFVETKPDKTKRNRSVRLLNKGVKFTEDIYFEGITRKQLEQLYFLLNISKGDKTSDSLHCYKLGSGKPLGLGSISVTVKEVKERKFDLSSELIFKEEKYEVQEKSYEENGFDITLKNEFELVTNFNSAKGIKVSYPLTENQYKNRYESQDGKVKPIEEGFKWFVENRGGKLKKRNQTVIKENLKPLKNASKIGDVALSCLKEIKSNSNN